MTYEKPLTSKMIKEAMLGHRTSFGSHFKKRNAQLKECRYCDNKTRSGICSQCMRGYDATGMI